MSVRGMKPLPLLKAYGDVGNPVIVAEFVPGKGWERQTYRKCASASWLRKLQAAGVTHVSVHFDHAGKRAPADFSIREILASVEG